MKYNYHIIVIGAGSAGLSVASGAAGLGAKVAIIESEKMGGDCLNTGCVPSKAFLKSAHLAKDIRTAEKFGLDSTIDTVDLSKVMTRVKAVINTIAPNDSIERYQKKGVDVFLGQGTIIDKNTVKVNDKLLTTKSIVIATGSGPVVPPIKGLKDIDYLINTNVFNLQKLPKRLVILGGGPIGLELGQGFKNLGSLVTIIDMATTLFGKDDKEVSAVMQASLEKDGITFELGSKIVEVKNINGEKIVVIAKKKKIIEIPADEILVSLGRTPNTKQLGLETVGIEVNKRGYIQTDSKLQTNIKNIYACGDVTGPFQFTHMASYQAGIVIRNCIFHLGAKVNYSTVAWTTYTKPEVAHVGYTEQWAKSENLFVKSFLVDLKNNDRAIAEGDLDGFLKLIIGKKNKIIGATLVGSKAGEMIPVASLAIKNKMTLSAFMGIIFSYPTQSEIFMEASLTNLSKSFKGWKKNLVSKIFLN